MNVKAETLQYCSACLHDVSRVGMLILPQHGLPHERLQPGRKFCLAVTFEVVEPARCQSCLSKSPLRVIDEIVTLCDAQHQNSAQLRAEPR